jgi:hypothetical protein
MTMAFGSQGVGREDVGHAIGTHYAVVARALGGAGKFQFAEEVFLFCEITRKTSDLDFYLERLQCRFVVHPMMCA